MVQKEQSRQPKTSFTRSVHFKRTHKSAKRVGARIRPVLVTLLRWLIVPAVFYGLVFFIMQPLYIGNFSNGFYLDNGDGFQNVWNIWWVNHALFDLHTNPYFTNMLHVPEGISLIPQTLNPINALMAIVLLHVFGLSLVQVVNFAVVFAFVFSGVTMFWFVKKLFGKYWVAIIAGALYTFSSYHFAHAQGHLQLVTFEFVPLFFLAFWTLLEKMKYRYAVLAALSLFLVLLSDYYYLFWSVIVAGLWFAWCLFTKRIRISVHLVKVMAVFATLAVALVGPLVYQLVHLSKIDPFQDAHNSTLFSLNPVSVVIPGGSSFFHSLTDAYTVHLQYLAESSVFFGFGLLALLLFAFIKLIIKKGRSTPGWVNFWWVILFVFGILALGPHLQVGRHVFNSVPLPYYFLEKLVPTLQISGMPMRWIFVALFAAIIIGSSVLARINIRSKKGMIVVILFIVVSLFDLWPRQLPLTSPTYRPYVSTLKQLPYGAVVDNGALTGSEQLYNQTLTGKPIAFGYVTRTTKSVDAKDYLLFAAISENKYDTLCTDFKIRYFTIPTTRPLDTNLPIVYDDGQTLIYDLKNSPEC